MTKLIHSDLSYQIRGVLFDIYNTLGPRLEEKYYTNAAAIGLRQKSIPCEVEKPFEIFYEGNRVGLYYATVFISFSVPAFYTRSTGEQ